MTSLRPWPLAALTSLALAAAAPAPVSATPVSGPTTVALTGPGADDLGRAKVQVRARGRAQAVTGERGRFVLPAVTASFAASGRSARVVHAGSLTLSRQVGGRTRRVVIRQLEVRLGSGAVVRARVGGRRMVLATLDVRRTEYTAQPATGVVRIAAARATLSAGAAAAIRRGLRLDRLRRAGFAVLGVNTAAPGASSAPAPGTSGTTGPTAPAATPIPAPASATAVAALAPLRWHIRESWVDYLGAGGTVPSAGAVASPGGTAYDVDFTPDPAQSWFSSAAGQGALQYRGRVAFRLASHGLDLVISDPRVELDGAATRVLATFGKAAAPTATGIGVLGTVDLAAASTAGTAPPAYAWTAAPLTLTDWANTTVFSGFYGPGNDDFGALALRVTGS